MTYKHRKDLSSVEKIYWMLRLLVDSNKGKLHQRTETLNKLSANLGMALAALKGDSATDVGVLGHILESTITGGLDTTTKTFGQLEVFVQEMTGLLDSTGDYKALLFCIDNLLVPSNDALSKVPTSEASQIAQTYAEATLNVRGEAAIGDLLVEWDKITIDMCLNKERDLAAELMFDIRQSLNEQAASRLNVGLSYVVNEQTKHEGSSTLTPSPFDYIASAALQEFERRVGQKRKQRSGGDLESATSFLFQHFGFKGADGPTHFNAAIEVDNWLRTKTGWYLGFSLKRTMRERWKQTRADKDELSSFKIRYIVHLIGNHTDPADTVIRELGSKRHIFFVPDESPVLASSKRDVVLRDYVKPMTELVGFLEQEVNR